MTQDQKDVSGAVRQVAKMFGNSEEDLLKYGFLADREVSKHETRERVLYVAKLFGLTEEDLKKYGGYQR